MPGQFEPIFQTLVTNNLTADFWECSFENDPAVEHGVQLFLDKRNPIKTTSLALGLGYFSDLTETKLREKINGDLIQSGIVITKVSIKDDIYSIKHCSISFTRQQTRPPILTKKWTDIWLEVDDALTELKMMIEMTIARLKRSKVTDDCGIYKLPKFTLPEVIRLAINENLKQENYSLIRTESHKIDSENLFLRNDILRTEYISKQKQKMLPMIIDEMNRHSEQQAWHITFDTTLDIDVAEAIQEVLSKEQNVEIFFENLNKYTIQLHLLPTTIHLKKPAIVFSETLESQKAESSRFAISSKDTPAFSAFSPNFPSDFAFSPALAFAHPSILAEDSIWTEESYREDDEHSILAPLHPTPTFLHPSTTENRLKKARKKDKKKTASIESTSHSGSQLFLDEHPRLSQFDELPIPSPASHCPASYFCPLTKKVLRYPYKHITTGITYERSVFLKFFSAQADNLICDYVTANAISKNLAAQALLKAEMKLNAQQSSKKPTIFSDIESDELLESIHLIQSVINVDDLPKSYFCPLTGQLMQNPYKNFETGITYEYDAFLKSFPNQGHTLIKDEVTSLAISRYQTALAKKLLDAEKNDHETRSITP